MKFFVVCVWGSPREGGNTEFLVKEITKRLDELGVRVEVFNLCRMRINPCKSCRLCLESRGFCTIKDDMTNILIPRLVEADGLIVASPVYFNNVSTCVKLFIDRTWCLRGLLRNIVGGAMVVGRGYGSELAISAIHAFMLKHEMILGFRGVTGFAFEKGEIRHDRRAIELVDQLANRMVELMRATVKLRRERKIKGSARTI